jgi:chromosomal replication initiation ATPase DnaA
MAKLLANLALETPKHTFATWIAGVTLLAHVDSQWVLGVKNTYQKDWLCNRMMGAFKRQLAELAGQPPEQIFFEVVGSSEAAAKVAALVPAGTVIAAAENPLPVVPPPPAAEKPQLKAKAQKRLKTGRRLSLRERAAQAEAAKAAVIQQAETAYAAHRREELANDGTALTRSFAAWLRAQPNIAPEIQAHLAAMEQAAAESAAAHLLRQQAQQMAALHTPPGPAPPPAPPVDVSDAPTDVWSR